MVHGTSSAVCQSAVRGTSALKNQPPSLPSKKMNRLGLINNHTASGGGHTPVGTAHSFGAAGVVEPLAPQNDSDIVVVAALRTAICKFARGGFKDTRADKLMSTVMQAAIDETGIDPAFIGDVCVGSTSVDLTQARVAQFEAGIPDSVPVKVTHRACSSGLQAVMDVAGAIRNGQTDVGMAVGCESLSNQRKMGKQVRLILRRQPKLVWVVALTSASRCPLGPHLDSGCVRDV
jgi:hypothetical protein